MPMVKYWRTSDKVAAKVTKDAGGSLVMHMEGEDEPFPGFPRGRLLFGPLSKLKHEIKNQIFNESWEKLENNEDIVAHVKDRLFNEIPKYYEPIKYDLVPVSRMNPPAREIWRAFEVLEKDYPKLKTLKEILVFILQEDDAYRFRVQWLVSIFNPSKWWYFGNPVRDFRLALEELEHAEVIGDMKERIRLLRRVLLALLADKRIEDLFIKFAKEVDWNKVALTKADKYHFRGKYFRVDLDKFEY